MAKNIPSEVAYSYFNETDVAASYAANGRMLRNPARINELCKYLDELGFEPDSSVRIIAETDRKPYMVQASVEIKTDGTAVRKYGITA